MTDTEQPFIAWEDYGSEGWQPRGFDSAEELLAYLLKPLSDNRKVLTVRMDLTPEGLRAANAKGEAS